MDLDEINKRICMLQDNLFEVDVNIRNKSIVYEQANSLQASQFGMTSVPRMKIDTSNYKMNCGLDTLAALFQDLCDKKGYKSDFYSRYCEISNKLKSDEFKLSEKEQLYTNLARGSSTNYPTYNRDKLGEAYKLIEEQVAILSIAFTEFSVYLEQNYIDKSGDYNTIHYDEYYDSSTTTTFHVSNSYDVLKDSLDKTYEIVKNSISVYK